MSNRNASAFIAMNLITSVLHLFRRQKESPAERVERALMRTWLVSDPLAMAQELGSDDDARRLIKEHRLRLVFNTHATEARWEVSTFEDEHRTFFCPEYKYDYPSLGDAVRDCIRKASTFRA